VALFKKDGGKPKYGKLTKAQRAITFYAEDGGSWPHYEPIVSELLGRHGRELAYLTSSESDPLLSDPPEGMHVFNIGDGAKRGFTFQTMEAGVVVATVPQLGTKLLPKSRLTDSLGTEHLYVHHSMASTHMIYEPDGFDFYEAILCVGPYMVAETRRREELQGLPAKELIEHGYGRLDTIIERRAELTDAQRAPNEQPLIVVAPSWGPHCLFESCGEAVVEALLATGAAVIARPHPMTRKHTGASIDKLAERFAGDPNFSLEENVASQDSLQRADLMVSDWSGAALEFAFGTERPVLFIDVPRKINNPGYEELGIEPFEATVREQIGKVVSPGDAEQIAGAVAELVGNRDGWIDSIRSAREANVYNVGRSGAVAADLIAEKADRYLQR
jgi:YidC/Oxa1 family membrane protein insertase